MSSLKRAFLFVTRKKGKSVLMFAVLLVIATFALTSLSIGKSSELAQESLRQSLGGELTVSNNTSENNPYRKTVEVINSDVKESNPLDETLLTYSEMPLGQKEIDAIMGIDGVESYDAKAEPLLKFADIEYLPGTVNPPGMLGFERFAKAYVTGSSEEAEYFHSGALALTEGRHFKPNDSNTAVISRDLAEKNGLKVGDTLSLLGYNERFENGILYESDTAVTEVTIVGLFEVTDPMLQQGSTMSVAAQHDMLENKVFIDMGSIHQIAPTFPMGFAEISFRVSDPGKLADIASNIQENALIDPQAFLVGIDDAAYANAAAPLERLSGLIITMLVIIAAVSALILSLILTMWARNRIHETGIYLSVGIKKAAIIGQYLAEVLMIAVLAFGLSCFTSSAIAGQIGNRLLQQNVPDVQISADSNGGDAASGAGFFVAGSSGIENVVPGEDGGYLSMPVDAQTEPAADPQISVVIGWDNVLQLYLFGFAIIVLSVGIAGMTVMRLKPREILSKMS